MLTLNVLITVKNEADIPKVRDLLKLQCQLSKKEPGCVRFNVYHLEEPAEPVHSQRALGIAGSSRRAPQGPRVPDGLRSAGHSAR